MVPGLACARSPLGNLCCQEGTEFPPNRTGDERLPRSGHPRPAHLWTGQPSWGQWPGHKQPSLFSPTGLHGVSKSLNKGRGLGGSVAAGL